MDSSSTVESDVACRIDASSNLASSLGRNLPIHKLDIAGAGIQPLPQVGSNQCGSWRSPIRLLLQDRIDFKAYERLLQLKQDR